MEVVARGWLRFMILMVMTTMAVFAAIESPTYTVVHSESDFEIRVIRASVWVSATVDEISFNQATQLGFHRLFQYIQGANLNSSRVPMTKPVLTGIVPSAGPFCSSAFAVRFYVPVEFQESPPTALPELHLKAEKWGEKCVAVRPFSGFAKDSNVAKQAALLEASLQKTPWANATDLTPKDGEDVYAIAQYSSPFQIFGRLNEVWVDIGDSDVCHLALKANVGSAEV
jgi:hypothetical protein